MVESTGMSKGSCKSGCCYVSVVRINYGQWKRSWCHIAFE